jgi:hypothetical protein
MSPISLTGARDITIDIAADASLSQAPVYPFFAMWIRPWSRKIVMPKAVAAIRDELGIGAPDGARARAWTGASA